MPKSVVFLTLVAVVNVLPLWAVEHLPFTDLPEHVASMATLRHWNDPSWPDRDLYEIAAGRSQYLAYHVFGAALSALLPADDGPRIANLLMVSAAGVALPFGLRALLRALGGDARLAIFACPLFWSRPLVIGLLPYVTALPVVLFTLAGVVRLAERPSWRLTVGVGLASVVVFYLHIVAFAVLAVVGVALAVTLPGREVRWTPSLLAGRLGWLVPSACATALWLVVADARGGLALVSDPSEVRFVQRARLARLFAAWAHDIWVSKIDEYTGVAFWVLIAWVGAQRGESEADGSKSLMKRMLPFACVLVLLTALPSRIGAGAMLNLRLAVPLALFVTLIPRPNLGRSGAWPLLLAHVLAVVVAGNAFLEIRRSREESAGLPSVLGALRPGSNVLGLSFDRSSKVTHSAPWVHAVSYHRLRGGGVAEVSFSNLSHWPLRYRADRAPPQKPAMFWDFKPCLYRNDVDGPYFDFLVVSGGVDPTAGTPTGPVFHPLLTAGRWTVFERVAGETIDGPPAESPCAATPTP